MFVFVKPLMDLFMFGMVVETCPKFCMVLFPTQYMVMVMVTDLEFYIKVLS